ncbi:sex-regulated protein janus-A isoform X2 [Bemisia tabaci]|uniref:sex-regulated protein janus-A isoform X2 n=1 Tax=Bemisia tabaci TaxID=7038 RepID=UPI003B289CD5
MFALIFKHFRSPSVIKATTVHLRTSTMATNNATMSPNLVSIPEVEIDPQGVFKYILMRVYDDAGDGTPNKLVVRGTIKGAYHADIFEMFLEGAHKLKLDCDVLGGGRINHDPENKKLKIYGYSQGFGKADHNVTASVLKKVYPDYTFECSDEGY